MSSDENQLNPVAKSVNSGTSTFQDDQFVLPFCLSTHPDYYFWFAGLMAEIRRVYGPFEYKYLVNYLKGVDPTPDLPKDGKYREAVISNVESLIELAFEHGMSKTMLIGRGPTLNLAVFKELHERWCRLNCREFEDVLKHYQNRLSDDKVLREACHAFVATFFTQHELVLMQDSRSSGPNSLVLDYFDHFDKLGEEGMGRGILDLSGRLYRIALSDSIPAFRNSSLDRCNFCNKVGHNANDCEKRESAFIEKPSPLGSRPTIELKMVWLMSSPLHVVNRKDVLFDFVEHKAWFQDVMGLRAYSSGYGKLRGKDLTGDSFVLNKVFYFPGVSVNIFGKKLLLGKKELTIGKEMEAIYDAKNRIVGRGQRRLPPVLPLTVDINEGELREHKEEMIDDGNTEFLLIITDASDSSF